MKVEKKKFTQAPLPFMGQKRKWNGEIKAALEEFDDCDVFIDLFGGSGLLSRIGRMHDQMQVSSSTTSITTMRGYLTSGVPMRSYVTFER